MNEIQSYIEKWQSLQSISEIILEELKQIDKESKTNIKIDPTYLSFKIPQIQIDQIKIQDELWIVNDSNTDYKVYKRSIWERILFHPEYYMKKDSKNHLKKCKEQYENRRKEIRRYISDDFKIQRELNIALNEISSSKSYNEFRIAKNKYNYLLRKIAETKSESVNNLIGCMLYSGIEFSVVNADSVTTSPI